MFYADHNHANALQALIIAKITECKRTTLELVTAMGYSKGSRSKTQRYAAIKRLHRVVQNDDLLITSFQLDKQSADLTYTSDEFVKQLCEVLHIPTDRYQPLLDKLIKKHHDVLNKPEIYARASIEFNEAFELSFSQTVYLSRFKSIKLPCTLRLLSKGRQEIIINKAWQRHYLQYKNNLPYGGKFMGLVLNIGNDRKTIPLPTVI